MTQVHEQGTTINTHEAFTCFQQPAKLSYKHIHEPNSLRPAHSLNIWQIPGWIVLWYNCSILISINHTLQKQMCLDNWRHFEDLRKVMRFTNKLPQHFRAIGEASHSMCCCSHYKGTQQCQCNCCPGPSRGIRWLV